MSAARRPPPSTARPLVCLLWLALARGASGGLQPELKLDSTGRAVRSVSYTEGSLPVALTSNLTLTAAGSSPCVTAVVQITNPVNAPLETLAVAADYRADVALTYVASTGKLTLSSAAILGLSGKDPTAALALALSRVTYQLASANPDSSPRAVTFLVTDAAGSSSRPTVAVVTIIPVNNPPVLILGGSTGAANGSFAAVLLEGERTTPLAIADPRLILTDVDNELLPGANITILGRLDGNAEQLQATVSGTSITATFNNVTGVLALDGLDSLESYRTVLASVRYRNAGQLTPRYAFSGGVRTVVVQVRDGAGGVAVANATVTCVPEPRIGVSGRDPSLPAPADCSGNGKLVIDPLTGDTSCDCTSSDGYTGDLCEIPPCNGHGTRRVGDDLCICNRLYSGVDCGVVCSGFGTVSNDVCKCNPGHGGVDCSLLCPGCLHGACNTTAPYVNGAYPANAAVVCPPCDPGWAGSNCSLPCPCYVGPDGTATANGRCLVSSDQTLASCLCSTGWTGSDCSVRCPSCLGATSGGGGSCLPPTGLEGGLTYVLSQLAALVTASTGDFTAASAQLSTYVTAGSVIGVSLTNGSFVADASAVVNGVCKCNTTVANRIGGVGFAGSNCSIPCRRCSYGTCDASGGCVCSPGYINADCSTQCNGNGTITWPQLSTSYTTADWDAQYGPNLSGAYTTAGGLFNTSLLYGFSSGDGLTLAYCSCTATAAGRFGFTGAFCDLACPNCGAHGTCITDANGKAVCKCSTTDPNAATTASEIATAAGFTTGVGWSGALCTVPCKPCINGTCDATGACACTPGFTDDACALECGAVGTDAPTGLRIGKRGTVAPTGAALGYGIGGSTAVCICDQGWAGPMCSKPCPYPYNATNGICVMRNASDIRDDPVDRKWSTRIVCGLSWTGLPPVDVRLPTGAIGAPGRDCSQRCSTCDAAGGTCQDGGDCLCSYGFLWQGPSPGKQGTFPYPQLNLPRDVFDATYHSCATRHPCNSNGEYINATCVGTIVPGKGTAWTQAAPLDGGWGCTDKTSTAPDVCAGGTILFAMAYTEVDAATGIATRVNPPPATFRALGTIQGGVCLPLSGSPPGTLPLSGGVCRCDGLARGRFKFPSSALLSGGAYDYDFQGWAGPTCGIPCAPCSQNGLCDEATGACVCHPGWAGFRCLVPCEPCVHGTCTDDGTCLCDGGRRLQDGTYALRLNRDPFYGTRGVHIYEAAGSLRNEYVSPAYATAAQVEDYLWEVEYECAHRPECSGRRPDTQLPARPNETYFRYSTAAASGGSGSDSPAAKLAALDAKIDALRAAILGTPYSMNGSALCDIPGPNVGLPSQGPDACLALMTQHKWGRTLAACAQEAGSQQWTCDSNLKMQFVLQLQAEVGSLLVDRTQLSTKAALSSLSVTRWLLNNRNERQRLMNTQVRGVFNVTTGAWSTVRDRPDYYTIWIMQQLMYGVTYGGGYSGWNCSMPCEPCDPEGGTCQFDGSCECIPGRYGADCSQTCACASLQVDGVNVSSATSASGRKIAPGGLCGRDGACVCYTDDTGISWAGDDCFTACEPCSHGHCNAVNGTCMCDFGWAGVNCDTRLLTDCLPCDADHGTCLSDGTCTCDAGWTGLDCSLPCAPCAHGDCQPNGACFCRDGWAGLDCSLHLGAPLARSAFSTSAGGWRVYNNSCSASSAPAAVRGMEADAGLPAAAADGACEQPGTGGDAGLTWDVGTGCLYVVDMLPGDSVAGGQIAYLRAPPSFTGNKLGAYGGTLAWNLHLTGDVERTPPGATHAPGAAPDAILIGGAAGFNVTPPAWEALNKQGLYNWSRLRFPELRLNLRWSRERLADTLAAYLATPQLALQYYAPRVPEFCTAAECSLNFAAPLAPGPGVWRNAPGGVPPGRWDWADTGDPRFVARLEGTPYSQYLSGSGPNPFETPFAFAAAGQPVPAGDDALTRRTGAAKGGEAVWTRERGDGTLPGPLAPSRTGPGTATAGENDGDNSYGVRIDTGRAATWDVLPTVYDAVALARSQRAGLNASASEIAWCLASLKELLLRADYLNATAPGRAPVVGPGEAVRLDDVALTGPDPLAGDATGWQASEHAAYLKYAQLIADTYSSAIYTEIAAAG